MKKCLLAIGLLFSLCAAPSEAAVRFSASSTDAMAGNSLTLQLGQTGSMFIWMSSDAGQIIDGVGIDILSSNAATLEATAYRIPTTNADGSLRWITPVTTGSLGDLVSGYNAFALPSIVGTGLATAGQDSFLLFSEVEFSATEIGSTELTLAANSFGFSQSGTDLASTLAGVTASVTAVPEPSSMALLFVGLGASCLRRRRRA